MASRTYRCRAIVLGRTKLAEHDLIVTLLADTGQQVRVVAKGARKPGGRLASKVEYFSEAELLVARGRNLGIISEASLANAHAALRGDPERSAAAFVVLEVARLTCFEDADDPYLFAICSRALRACEETQSQETLDTVVAAYVFKVMAHSGWRPELDRCVLCGDEDVSFFSSSSGGLVCSSCVRSIEGGVEMGMHEIRWLRFLIRATFDELISTSIDQETSLLLLSLAHSWAATHLDARLRAFEFLMSL